MLVEPGRDADRIGKIQAKNPHGEPPVIARSAQQRSAFQHLDDEPMRIFRLKLAQKRLSETIE
jgi:hypothetical protein